MIFSTGVQLEKEPRRTASEEWAEAEETIFVIETVCDLWEVWAEAKETVFIIETVCDLCEVWAEAKETVCRTETDYDPCGLYDLRP